MLSRQRLAVANTAENVFALREQFSNAEVAILCVVWDAYEAASECGFSAIKPGEFITNKDHYELAELVVGLSDRWWEMCFPGQAELEVDGLGIREIVAYELEQLLTDTIFRLAFVVKAIDLLSPQEVYFPKASRSGSTFHNYMQPTLSDFEGPSIAVLLEASNSPSFKLSFYDPRRGGGKSSTAQKTSRSHRVKGTLNQLKHYTPKAFIRRQYSKRCALHRLFRFNSIILNTQPRLSSGFVKIAEKTRVIDYFVSEHAYSKTIEGVSSDRKAPILSPDFKAQVFVRGVNFQPWINTFAKVVVSKVVYYRAYYNRLQRLLRVARPQLYATTGFSAALDRLNLWAFYRLGVRRVVLCEGLGQPTEDVWMVSKQGANTAIPHEKWIVSDFYRNELEKRKLQGVILRVVGILSKEYASSLPEITRKTRLRNLYSRLSIKQGTKVILYASTSMLFHKNIVRFVSEEATLEVFRTTQDIIKAISLLKYTKLLIKPHPADQGLERAHRDRLQGNEAVKVVTDVPTHELIDLADLVIVSHSSVGLESLYRGKHLVIYNHIKRPSYLTGIYDALNKDPNIGPAARLAANREELVQNIHELLESSGQRKHSPNLEHLLENVKPKYSMDRVVGKLLEQ